MTAAALESFSPYSTIQDMITAKPQWMSSYDADRIMSYQIYEQIYWNVPDTFKLTARGTDAQPIYVPTARTIIDTTNRYVGKGWSVTIDPDYGTPDDQNELRMELTKLFRRERFFSNFNSNKRYGAIRGDWCFHVIGNLDKLEGRRITLEALDPASYFPVTHPTDPDRIIGAHIVYQFETDDGTVLKRQSYWKGSDPINNDGSDMRIFNEVALFNMESWEEFDAKPVTVIKPLTQLPEQITSIPIYHIRHIETPGDPWGSSSLRGFERILAAINQAVSDEELALALEGLGMYWTDAGAPIDPITKKPTDWVLGPGRVVEVPAGRKFDRINGVSSVTPVMDHLKFMIASLKEASNTPDVAIGKVEQAVAESGISLSLQMGPMLAMADELDENIAGTMDQMLFDLTTMWLPAYELIDIEAVAESTFGEKLPANKQQDISDILSMVEAGVASAEWARGELAKLGFIFPEDEGTKLTAEQAARAAAIDPFSARAAAELDKEETDGQ